MSEATYPEVAEVDAKLMAYARDTGAAILTNDYNLNRVADLQGIRVLNINELANAVKSVAHPGEEMSVRIIQEGKEPGQGVGYLDDGTMIVVEGGVRFMDSEIPISVTRVLQTVAGRMIFAQPRGDTDRPEAAKHDNPVRGDPRGCGALHADGQRQAVGRPVGTPHRREPRRPPDRCRARPRGVAVPADAVERFTDALPERDGRCLVVPGGEARADSVIAGLWALPAPATTTRRSSSSTTRPDRR